MKSVLSAKHFHNEEAAYAFVEARLWPNGPVCPHCGGVERISKMGGQSTRIGAYKCYQCRKPFTVKVGTILRSPRSHAPLAAGDLPGRDVRARRVLSSDQLHRILGCTLETAWFISHRSAKLCASDGPIIRPWARRWRGGSETKTFIGSSGHAERAAPRGSA